MAKVGMAPLPGRLNESYPAQVASDLALFPWHSSTPHFNTAAPHARCEAVSLPPSLPTTVLRDVRYHAYRLGVQRSHPSRQPLAAACVASHAHTHGV